MASAFRKNAIQRTLAANYIYNIKVILTLVYSHARQRRIFIKPKVRVDKANNKYPKGINIKNVAVNVAIYYNSFTKENDFHLCLIKITQ